MTEFSQETERRALSLINADLPWIDKHHAARRWASWPIICRLIDEQEAFRKEVSDAVKQAYIDTPGRTGSLNRFIIPEPEPVDPVLAAMVDEGLITPELAKELSEALTKRERPDWQAQAEALAEALRTIQIEADRKEGNWTHLKRAIGIHARQALAAYSAMKGKNDEAV